MYLAKVYIQPRPTVSDPQGQTIRGGLLQLGFDSVSSVRAGKYMEITLEADNEASASDQVRQMCDKLLANPVIEDYPLRPRAVERISRRWGLELGHDNSFTVSRIRIILSSTLDLVVSAEGFLT